MLAAGAHVGLLEDVVSEGSLAGPPALGEPALVSGEGRYAHDPSNRFTGGQAEGDATLEVADRQVGTPLSRRNLTRSFKALLKRAGLPRTVRFHDLRHTCATLLLGKGFNGKFVQELLGHATIAITLDTYSHVMPGMANHATTMEDALS